jgi:hypothetical protein
MPYWSAVQSLLALRGHGCLLAGLLLFGAAVAAPPPQRTDEAPPVELENLRVTARPAPLDAQRELLRQLVDRSAPCLGCDVARRDASRAQRLRQMLFGTPPPEPDEAQLAAFEVKLKEAPDLEYLRR